MTIYITNQQKHTKIDCQKIENLTKNILLYLNQSGAELSILLVDDGEMQKLNQQYRGIDKTTDVLSFEASLPGISSPVLGDVVISVETAQKQALERGHDIIEEILHLLVHGILHLLGYDHEISEEEYLIMALKEQDILNFIKKGND